MSQEQTRAIMRNIEFIEALKKDIETLKYQGNTQHEQIHELKTRVKNLEGTNESIQKLNNKASKNRDIMLQLIGKFSINHDESIHRNYFLGLLKQIEEGNKDE